MKYLSCNWNNNAYWKKERFNFVGTKGYGSDLCEVKYFISKLAKISILFDTWLHRRTLTAKNKQIDYFKTDIYRQQTLHSSQIVYNSVHLISCKSYPMSSPFHCTSHASWYLDNFFYFQISAISVIFSVRTKIVHSQHVMISQFAFQWDIALSTYFRTIILQIMLFSFNTSSYLFLVGGETWSKAKMGV